MMMPIPRSRRALARVLSVAAVVACAAPGAARAATVKGVVKLPDGARSSRTFKGYWRIENGTVPVRGASHPGTVVVVDGISGARPPPPATVTVEIANLEASKKVVVVGPGSVIEFKNVGKTTHELSTPNDSSIMPLERLNPGTFRHQKFTKPGGYVVRCAEYPHLAISVIVVETTYFATADDKTGAFSIPGVPDAKGTLRVWSGGGWMHEQPVDASSKQDLTIRITAGEAEAKADDAGKDAETAAEGQHGAE